MKSSDDYPDHSVGLEWTELQLGALIQRARRDGTGGNRSFTQEGLAKELGISPASVGAIEQGSRLPTLPVLVEIAHVLFPDERARAEVLPRWLAKWLATKTGKLADGLPPAAELRNAAGRLVEALMSPRRPLPADVPRSLEGFPEQFQPLVAVLPDRREVPPKSPADLFIRSGAVTDYQFMPLLHGMDEPVRICSDKLFLVMPDEWLRESFSQANLLVVGSSGVNWLTRSLADKSIFRPVVEEPWLKWHRHYCRYREYADLDHDDFFLSAFWHVLEYAKTAPYHHIDERKIPTANLPQTELDRLPEAVELAKKLLRGQTESIIVHQFWVAGFADPADGQRHGTLPSPTTDFGAISLAPHPFDDTGRFVAIVCAGIHGPGTAHAIKALATAPARFDNHPFGGVIKVRLPGRRDWPARFEMADWHWQTPDYKPEKILANLRMAQEGKSDDNHPAFQYWTPDGLQDTIDFVSSLIGR